VDPLIKLDTTAIATPTTGNEVSSINVCEFINDQCKSLDHFLTGVDKALIGLCCGGLWTYASRNAQKYMNRHALHPGSAFSGVPYQTNDLYWLKEMTKLISNTESFNK